jgi:hypothetical protein
VLFPFAIFLQLERTREIAAVFGPAEKICLFNEVWAFHTGPPSNPITLFLPFSENKGYQPNSYFFVGKGTIIL